MPRESVHPSTPGQSLEDGTEVPQPFLIQVGWHRDFHANVGITLPDGETLLSRFYGDTAQLEGIGAMLLWWLQEELPRLEQRIALSDAAGEALECQMLGAQVLTWVQGQRADAGGNDGLWVDVDRSMANRLITLVRKARDAAYGKDA